MSLAKNNQQFVIFQRDREWDALIIKLIKSIKWRKKIVSVVKDSAVEVGVGVRRDLGSTDWR